MWFLIGLILGAVLWVMSQQPREQNIMEEHKEYKVKLTAQEIFELKDHHRELMEDRFTYEGALVLGVVDQILNQNKE